MYEYREANSNEFSELGELMVAVYSQLEDFPKQDEQPEYYERLRSIGEFTKAPKAKLFVAVSSEGKIDGGVAYFGDTRYYGAGGKATLTQKAGAFRLLAVNPEIRGKGLGKNLIWACIDQAKKDGHTSVVIHSTKAMMVAWRMYERMGFKRFTDIDFSQGELSVYGFRLVL